MRSCAHSTPQLTDIYQFRALATGGWRLFLRYFREKLCCWILTSGFPGYPFSNINNLHLRWRTANIGQNSAKSCGFYGQMSARVRSARVRSVRSVRYERSVRAYKTPKSLGNFFFFFFFCILRANRAQITLESRSNALGTRTERTPNSSIRCSTELSKVGDIYN